MSPFDAGIIDRQPTMRMKRGLTLMCKILQSTANHVLFTKEQHMRVFNEFLKANFEVGRKCERQCNLPPRFVYHASERVFVFAGFSWRSRPTVRRSTQERTAAPSSATPTCSHCIVCSGSTRSASETTSPQVATTKRSDADLLTRWQRCWLTSDLPNTAHSTHSILAHTDARDV